MNFNSCYIHYNTVNILSLCIYNDVMRKSRHITKAHIAKHTVLNFRLRSSRACLTGYTIVLFFAVKMFSILLVNKLHKIIQPLFGYLVMQ